MALVDNLTDGTASAQATPVSSGNEKSVIARTALGDVLAKQPQLRGPLELGCVDNHLAEIRYPLASLEELGFEPPSGSPNRNPTTLPPSTEPATDGAPTPRSE